MISEKVLSKKYGVIWKQVFPLLTKQFITEINKSLKSTSVTEQPQIQHDLVAEVASDLVEFTYLNGFNLPDINKSLHEIKDLINKTMIFKNKEDDQSKIKSLTDEEIKEIQLVANNLFGFIKKNKGEVVIFNPELKGYQFISNVFADLAIDDTLYEIKTVKRNFITSDLKQLIIYLALQQVSEFKTWKYGGLYNPRSKVHYKFEVSKLVSKLSGGKTAPEAFEELLNAFERDIKFDSRF